MKSKAHLLKRAIWLKSLFLTACLLLATIPAFSQTKTVTGTVTDAAGDALIGVSILVQGSNNGVVTDLDGKYTLNNVPENATLIISYIGMLTQEVKVNGQSIVNVTLKEDSQQLEEVVVIGYGAAKAKDLTAPITVVKGEALTTVPSTTPMAALQGKVPGVNIVNNGAPGEGPTVQIRGIGSFYQLPEQCRHSRNVYLERCVGCRNLWSTCRKRCSPHYYQERLTQSKS